MGKYIHLFENESAFNADYYTENYLEPWVSLTKKKIGNVKSFIVNPEGTDLTCYYQFQDDTDNFVWTDTYEEFEITAVDTSNSAITIGNIVANYHYEAFDGQCSWYYSDESTHMYQYYLTNNSTPQVGDIAILYSKNDTNGAETRNRNPKVGDIVEYWSPESDSIETSILTIENEEGIDLNRVNYNKKELPLEEVPLTFEIQGDGNIYWSCDDSLSTEDRVTIEYSKNGGEWTSITSATGDTAPSISVVSGDIIQFRGDNPTYGISYGSQNRGCFQSSNAAFKIKGNIMSLINSTNFPALTTLELESEFTFYHLFNNCTGLTDASKLILPATTLLAYGCYNNMFQGCTSLTTAPSILPATTLAQNCYNNMFDGCTNLVNAPALPATTLAFGCYQQMFQSCTSLTTAPALPATTLTQYCYRYMFRGCTSLTTAPELPATTLADSCYYRMFYGCTGLTQGPSSIGTSATTMAASACGSMFEGCTSLTTAPELPAETLANYCYYQMFQNCSSLNNIKCLATDISASGCTTDWVSGVASSGTFVKDPSMSDWTTGNSGIPSGWTVQDV